MSVKTKINDVSKLLILVILVTLSFGFSSPSDDGRDHQKRFRRVLILGNSITKHGPKPEIGWHGNWGMAASAEKNDFVHLLIGRFQERDKRIAVDYQNIADFEKRYWEYDLSKLDSLFDQKPDLIILRLSENVDSAKIKEHQFEKHYTKFIAYLKSKSPQVKLLHAISFWDRQSVTEVMAKVSQANQDHLINLKELGLNPSNMALGQFANKGVAMHPSDQGMKAIAEAIWEKVIQMDNSLKR